jgi:hypothetical protein
MGSLSLALAQCASIVFTIQFRSLLRSKSRLRGNDLFYLVAPKKGI